MFSKGADGAQSPIAYVSADTSRIALSTAQARPGPADGVQNLGALYQTLLHLVLRDRHDLSTLQMAGLLSVYVTDETQSLGELAGRLGVSRPMATRIIDRLEELRLVRRRPDRNDRRRVLIAPTQDGLAYVTMMAEHEGAG